MRLCGSLLLGVAVGSTTMLAAAEWTLPRPVEPAGAIPRIGNLSPTSPGGANQEAFLRGLQALGYVEGKTIAIESRFAYLDDSRLDDLAAELVRSRVRLVVAWNPGGAIAAKHATQSIPIVFAAVADPLGLGLVHSLARPGGNITGLANMPADLNLKRLEILRDALPAARRIAFVARSGNPNSGFYLDGLAATAAELGMRAAIYPVAGVGEYESAFATMAQDGIEAALIIQDGMFLATRMEMMETAFRHRIPAMAESLEYADSKALLAYGIAGYAPLYEHIAVYVDKILKGAKPSELPVDQPLDLALVVNLDVGRALGITLPRSLLLRANQVVE